MIRILYGPNPQGIRQVEIQPQLIKNTKISKKKPEPKEKAAPKKNNKEQKKKIAPKKNEKRDEGSPQAITTEAGVETKAEGWTNFDTSKGDTAKLEAQAGATVYSSQDECAIIKQEVMGEESRSIDYKDETLPKVNR